ncbi:MAG TPA: ribosome assembly factor SBDS [Candidatus Saccharimonadales bacterium]|nr:ribosome assembly factor SBDS [Candidatus Saccharimonadales bacterium]
MSKTVIAKYSVSGEEFEIFVDSDMAYEYITGKRKDPMSVLQTEEVFKNANKGERQTQEKIKKIFNTEDLAKIAETILKKGEVPITTEQRHKLVEEKRKQIVNIIAVNSIDPRTSAPHTPTRIENAMEQARVTIDPFKNANEQVDGVIKKINMILPLKFATAKIEAEIPASYANRCYGTLKQYGLKSEEWQSNGSLKAVLEFPAGLKQEFFDKMNGLTKGEVQIKVM